MPDSGIGAVLLSARSLAEYRAMFALSDVALRRRLLDCPGGAASLTAEVNAAGGDATAVGYPYLHQLLAELADHCSTTQVVNVDYEFQAGGNQMLVCTHRPADAS